MGDIEIPAELQWVSYLAGDSWPQGSESGMRRVNEYYSVAAAGSLDLIPELNRVRSETLSVLFGDTAQAAEQHFALLFDGDLAVDKLADAVAALGDVAAYLGSEIEYSKLSIVFALAVAAREISRALAMSGSTGGSSVAQIPIFEAVTASTIRQAAASSMRRAAAKVRDMLARTTVKQLVVRGRSGAFEELLQTAGIEGAVAGFQGQDYLLNPDRLLLNAVAAPIGGGAAWGQLGAYRRDSWVRRRPPRLVLSLRRCRRFSARVWWATLRPRWALGARLRCCRFWPVRGPAVSEVCAVGR